MGIIASFPDLAPLRCFDADWRKILWRGRGKNVRTYEQKCEEEEEVNMFGLNDDSHFKTMKVKPGYSKIASLFLVSFIIACQVNAQHSKKGIISQEDRRELIAIVLDKPNFEFADDDGDKLVYLSGENIASFIGVSEIKVDDFIVRLLTQNELDAQKRGIFKYYAFDPFIIKKKAVIITIKLISVRSGSSGFDGTQYRCIRKRKTWKCSPFGYVLQES